MMKYFVGVALCAIVSCQVLAKDIKEGEVVIHATGNDSVPDIYYVIDAVELLREAYEVFPDEQSRANGFLELYTAKHGIAEWNLVVGYTFLKTDAKYFVEVEVMNSKNLQGDSKKATLYMLFSTQKNGDVTTTTSSPTTVPTKPTVPTTKPTVPTTNPTAPTTKPTVPTTKPTVPTTNPTVPTTKPTVPTTVPTRSTAPTKAYL